MVGWQSIRRMASRGTTDGGLAMHLTTRSGFVPKKRTETNIGQSGFINTHLCVNFSEHKRQRLSQVAGFGPTQHVIGPQEARQAEHRLADHREVLGGFVEGDALT